MLGNLGFGEILVLMLIILLLFGAKRLPEMGASIGKGIREFKRSLSDTQDAIMGDEQRNALPPRQGERPMDTAVRGTPTSGEPKRLSQ